MTDIAKIADGLTVAQRNVILNSEHGRPGIVYGNEKCLWHLVDKGVAQDIGTWRVRRLTPLGLAVRAHLIEQARDA